MNLYWYLNIIRVHAYLTIALFNTGKEITYTIDGFYPDGTYLLTVDGKDVLVVWQAVDGENE